MNIKPDPEQKIDQRGQKDKKEKRLQPGAKAALLFLALILLYMGYYGLTPFSKNYEGKTKTSLIITTTTMLNLTLPSGLKLEYRDISFPDAFRKELIANAQIYKLKLTSQDVEFYLGRSRGPPQPPGAPSNREIIDLVHSQGDHIKNFQKNPNYFEKIDGKFASIIRRNGRFFNQSDRKTFPRSEPYIKLFGLRQDIEVLAKMLTPKEIEEIEKMYPKDSLIGLRKNSGFSSYLRDTGLDESLLHK